MAPGTDHQEFAGPQGSWYFCSLAKYRRVKSNMRFFTWTLVLSVLTQGWSLTLSDDPKSLEGLLTESSAKVQAGDLAGAESLLKTGLNAFGDDPDLLKALGTVYQRQLRFLESIEVFQKILKRAPVYPEVNLCIGISYYALNQFNDAVAALNAELA